MFLLRRVGAREQINQNSAYLDISQVYGEHSCMARDLRSYGGRLNVTRHPIKGKDLLPQSPVHPECKAPSGYCFIAGVWQPTGIATVNNTDHPEQMHWFWMPVIVYVLHL